MDEMNIFETAPNFPVIPLRGLVMFPDMVLHFDLFSVPKGRSGG